MESIKATSGGFDCNGQKVLFDKEGLFIKPFRNPLDVRPIASCIAKAFSPTRFFGPGKDR